MALPGLALVREAQKNGAWNNLNDVENIIVPPDLKLALEKIPQAKTNFDQFPRSSKKNILEWILNAKHPDTRKRRIEKTVKLAKENIRANHYRRPKNY